MAGDEGKDTSIGGRVAALFRGWLGRESQSERAALEAPRAQARRRTLRTPLHLPQVLAVARGRVRGAADVEHSRPCFLALTGEELFLLEASPHALGASWAGELLHAFRLRSFQVVWAGRGSFLLREGGICVSVDMPGGDQDCPSQAFLVRYLRDVSSPKLPPSERLGDDQPSPTPPSASKRSTAESPWRSPQSSRRRPRSR